ncbi:CidA/LrgA family protein [Enterobacter cloacae]|uniref:CidA/LrgA family protein n=1 Tax=Enterobacter cloacae TaxID=550 RepID=UPI0021D3BA06|nr:CidA/LrgA family protein [Enterobacter cloacae]
MPASFVSIAVGVMNYYDTLSAQLLPIIVACVVSTFIAMCAVALSSEFIHRRHVPVPEQQEADAVAAAEHTEQQEKRKC